MKSTTNYIALALIGILVIYLAMLDTLAKPLFESQASEMYGAEVTVDSLKISPFVGKVTLYQLQVADRRNAMRNLAQAERAYIDISILKLAEDILDLEDVQIDGLVVMTPREEPARILRPLLEDDNPIALAGLPNFKLPDVDSLIARKRHKVDADIAAIRQTFAAKEEKWRAQLDTIPSREKLDSYQSRIRELENVKGAARQTAAVQELQTVTAELGREINKLQSMQAEFRGDLQLMREAVDLAAGLAGKHTSELISSLGLNNEQIAQLGSQMLRGDFDGLLQQVLAPLAYNQSGDAASADDMPIFIRRASFNGQLLHAAAGLSTQGELTEFTWPLELATAPALLKITGSSLGGGDILINASVDHRDSAQDLVSVAIDQLPLWEMELAGNPNLAIVMKQARASINGELSLQGENLSGNFTQQMSQAVFDTSLSGDAGEASQLLAQVLQLTTEFMMQMGLSGTVFEPRLLQLTTEFMMQMGLSGTVFEPRLSLSTDLDQVFQQTVRNAISGHINQLTTDLQNQISSEIGPELANARASYESLESLQGELEQTLQKLSGIQP
jgi:hypothetical protein